MRVLVNPRPEDRLGLGTETLHRFERSVAVAVGPAGKDQRRRAEGAEVLADRAVAPVDVAPLMAQPGVQQKGLTFQPLDPELTPALADQSGIGRARRIGKHRPDEHTSELQSLMRISSAV